MPRARARLPLAVGAEEQVQMGKRAAEGEILEKLIEYEW
jgi:hypothetical protein